MAARYGWAGLGHIGCIGPAGLGHIGFIGQAGLGHIGHIGQAGLGCIGHIGPAGLSGTMCEAYMAYRPGQARLYRSLARLACWEH